MPRPLRRLLAALLLLALLGGLVVALLPRPIAVDLATAARGPMRTTVDEDGRTRIKERYTVSAPLAGRLSRITLKAGDPVTAGQTVLAVIDPGDPALLDPRARAQAQARVSGAEAALQQAEATLASANAALEQAQTNLSRQQEAQRRGIANQKELEDATTTQAIREAERKAAGFAVEIARFEVEQARAALVRTAPAAGENPDEWRFEIRAPVSGRILRIHQESSTVLTTGTPLVDIGDPADLEAVVDVLSTEAVAIRPGAPVEFLQWGGEKPLAGIVRVVEPAAFTKISALGVEEQRVNIVIDFAGPPEARAGLGDGYRVEASIITWEAPAVLKIPTGALFRQADSWAVYLADRGRASVRPITLGHRNAQEAQVLSGLAEGDQVIAYPSDQVHLGARIVARPSGP